MKKAPQLKVQKKSRAHLHARPPHEIAGDRPLVVDEIGAEKLTGISRFLFRRMRLQARGPVVVHLGKLCKYRVSDIEKWLDAHRETPAEFAAARAKRRATAPVVPVVPVVPVPKSKRAATSTVGAP